MADQALLVDLLILRGEVLGRIADYERAADLAQLLPDANTFFYVCGLKSMEEGVVLALRDVAQQAGLDWDSVGAALKLQGRLHLETY